MIHLKTQCLFYLVGTVQFTFSSYWKHARTIIIIAERFPASCYLGFILNAVVLCIQLFIFPPFSGGSRGNSNLCRAWNTTVEAFYQQYHVCSIICNIINNFTIKIFFVLFRNIVRTRYFDKNPSPLNEKAHDIAISALGSICEFHRESIDGSRVIFFFCLLSSLEVTLFLSLLFNFFCQKIIQYNL